MTTLLARARRGAPLGEIDIVDIHGHLGRWSFARPHTTAADLVGVMDRLGVRTCLCSHTQCMSAETTWGNDVIAEAARAFPGRILGYVTLWPGQATDLRQEAERRFREGFVGLKLHNSNGFAYAHAGYAPALALAAERCAPVLLHTWGHEHEFTDVRTVAARYPDASFILGHAGATHEERYLAAAREFANVYLDLTFSLSPRGLVERLVAGAGADKVLWGSDGCFLNMAQQIGKVIGSTLSAADQVRVLATNARRLLDRVRR